MLLYKTIKAETVVEQTIERSKFIGHIKPVENRDEAETFFNEIRRKHRNATHNVPAMVLGDKFQTQWASDDGEPQGTSGTPMMQMLINEGITNVAVIVTRYFGGIKLGTGGLVRAYTSTAKMALESAGICGVETMKVFTVKVNYSDHAKIINLIPEWGGEVLNEDFTDKVTLTLKTKPEETDNVKKSVINFTGNQCEFGNEEERLEKTDLTK
ncbi:MAG: YigZ family protein [Clostridiales bacterium]|nr:YigZ family protein [Clostridiales bacterium]MDD7348104.1 YigZ family protein [Clostridiales bacterium]MDY4060341.1 YigZ family protein [Anaerovoracaceae bacterium]